VKVTPADERCSHTGEAPAQTRVQGAGARAAKPIALLASAALDGRVTSISIDNSPSLSNPKSNGAPFVVYVGTAAGNIYQALIDLRGKEITPQLVQSAHTGAIHAVAFPERYGEARCRLMPALMATALLGGHAAARAERAQGRDSRTRDPRGTPPCTT
jgi:hypothetical protein